MALLPEAGVTRGSKFVSGDLLEGVDEFCEVAELGHAFGEEVYVVRHGTIGVEEEILSGGGFQKLFYEPVTGGRMGEEFGAVSGDDGYEMGARADVVCCRKT